MADGKISIEMELKGKDKLISDTKQADRVLNEFGRGAGDKMDSSIRENVGKVSGQFSHLKEIMLGTLSAGWVQSGISSIKNGVVSLWGDLSDASAAWQTFDGNMKNLHMPDAQIAKTRKGLQDYAQATIYSASDMASTYSQLAAVGTKNTEQLVEGFGGLAAAATNPAQAMMTLSQQATQMAAKPKVAWEDFKLMVEQSPAGMAAVAKSMNMSLGSLIKQIQAGKLSTDDFFAAVAKVGTNKSFSQMATQYKTVGQAVDGLKESLTNDLMGAFNSVSKAGIRSVNLLTDQLGKIDFNGLAAGIVKPIDYINAHFDTVVDIAKNVFKIGEIIGGTIWQTAYDVVINIAKAFGLVDDSGKAAKDPLEAIDDILKNLVAHKTEIANLTRIWLAFLAVEKITTWISAINKAKESLMEFELVQKAVNSLNGNGFNISVGSKGGATAKTKAINGVEDVAQVATNNTGLLSKVKGFFTKTKSASTAASVVSDSGGMMDDLADAGSTASKFSKAAGAAKGLAGIGTAITLLSSVGDLLGSTKKTLSGNVGKAVGGAAGTWAGGAAAGALVGTFAGPIGTGVGAAVGAALGGIAGSAVGKEAGKAIGKRINDGVEWAFHPKISNGVDKETDKLKGGIKTFAKSYQSDMDKINGDTIMLASSSGKQAAKIEADMLKTYAHMSKSVDNYYKEKESKSQKDLEVLVKNGDITQKQADEALAKEKKSDSSRAAQMKAAYKAMQKESEDYYKQKQAIESKYDKASDAAAAKVEKERNAQRLKLVKDGASKAELASFDAKTAKKVAEARKKAKDGEDKEIEAAEKKHQAKMDSLRSKANKVTYASLKINAGKEKDLLEDLANTKQKLSQKELKNVISTSTKQTKAVISAANKTYKDAKGAAEKKYKATVNAADKEYYENHTISKAQYKEIVKNATDQKNDTIATAKTQRDGTVKHAKEQHSQVVSEATKQAGQHKDAVNSETGEVKGAWDKFVDGVAGIWNGIIDGWNTLNNLWGGKNASHWKRYAGGTGGTLEDQLAVVGEEGFELAHHPQLGLFPLGVNGMETAFLPAGTSILPHAQSKQFMEMSAALPHHADGVFGSISDMFDKVKKTAGGIGSSIAHAFGSAEKFIAGGVSGAWKWLVNKTGADRLSKFGSGMTASMMHQIGSGSYKDVAAAFKRVFAPKFKKAKEDEDADTSEPSGSGVKRWKSTVIKALEKNGLSTSASMVAKVLRQIATESGGNSHAVQGNIGDINNLTGDLAKGLMQTISTTFNANAFPGHHNIFNGYDNLLAALRYAKNRYGSSLSYLGQGHGYANGGVIKSPEILLAGEDGAEYIVNTKKDSADDLLAQAITERAQQKPDGIFARALASLREANTGVIGNASMTAVAGGSGAAKQLQGTLAKAGDGTPDVLEIHVHANLDKHEMSKEMAEPIRVQLNKLSKAQLRAKGVI